MAQYYEDNKITYQQIVMAQIKVIQNITSKELRDATKTIKNLVGEQTVEAEDTRYSYLQSVGMLGDLLSPYFNSDVKDKFESYDTLINLELIEALNDNEFLSELEKHFNKKDIKNLIIKDEGIKNQANVYFLNFKMQSGRIMFRSLVKLFKEQDFLGNEMFSDSGEADDSLEAVDETEED